MPKPVVARPARDQAETATILVLAAAPRGAPAEAVWGARIVALSWGGARVAVIAARLGCPARRVRRCLHRFNAQGVPGMMAARRKPVRTLVVVGGYL